MYFYLFYFQSTLGNGSGWHRPQDNQVESALSIFLFEMNYYYYYFLRKIEAATLTGK